MEVFDYFLEHFLARAFSELVVDFFAAMKGGIYFRLNEHKSLEGGPRKMPLECVASIYSHCRKC